MIHPYEIIPYEDRYQPDFKSLNLEWLDLNNLTEQRDLDVLNNPRTEIIDAGGFIFLIRYQDEIVGTGAIMKVHDHVFELAKMSVAPAHRGKGLSKTLLDHCITKAKDLNADKLVLFSHHSLTTALTLYEKFGFQHVAVEDSPFLTADIKMELMFVK